MRIWSTYAKAMKFKSTALLVAIALLWAGFSSNAMAFSDMHKQMPGMEMDHDMGDMAMQDCPGHSTKPDTKMTMDSSKCAVACYGLAAPALYEPRLTFDLRATPDEMPSVALRQVLFNRPVGVPTPPPNFA